MKLKRIGKYAVIWVPPTLLLAAFLFRAKLFELAVKIGRHMFCPLYAFTGIFCPGCGGTRATIALLHGDILLSLRCNPSVVCIAIFLLLFYAEQVCKVLGKPKRLFPRSLGFWLGAVAVLLIWSVLRNFFPVLQPPIDGEFMLKVLQT